MKTMILQWSALIFTIICGYYVAPSTVPPVTTTRYMISNKSTPCPGAAENHSTCLILDQYVSEQDTYFIDGAIVYFYSGDHQLTSSLWLENLQKFTFQGSADSRITIEPSINITLKTCKSIKISSLIFNLAWKFTHFLIFRDASYI